MNSEVQKVVLHRADTFTKFDGIGTVNGGGATSVLLKDYPPEQRDQILDLVYKPMFGASVSALLVEIPGDGNSTQGTMPSHMRSPDDLDFERGYIWWVLSEVKKRNPDISLDAVAWSAPGWIGNGEFWSKDTAHYYVKWLQGLKDVYGIKLDAIGCRNEKGVSFEFAQLLRSALDQAGFAELPIHAFDNWNTDKFDFVAQLAASEEAKESIAIIGAHVMHGETGYAPREVQDLAKKMGKPIWNTEDHVYKDGFDCLISIVECFNKNFILGGANRITLWYDIGGVYPVEPYSKLPPMILAHEPWSGHYHVREALWGYAHYGQFTKLGWFYLNDGCIILQGGGSVVTLTDKNGHISFIIESKGAAGTQVLDLDLGPTWDGQSFCVWRSTASAQFENLIGLEVKDGHLSIEVEKDSVYSLSNTGGQIKGNFDAIPSSQPFPMPYEERFDAYSRPADRGYLPKYFADIGGVFELVKHPTEHGYCLQQVVSGHTISWAPEWHAYSIIGDLGWKDYSVSVSVKLGPSEQAGVMGRVCHVGSGYGYVPEGYYFCLSADGWVELVKVRGKENKEELVGDAEQQAMILAKADRREGGEQVIARAEISGQDLLEWNCLEMTFKGGVIKCQLNGQLVLEVVDTTYPNGMAGILARRGGERYTTAYFDQFTVGRY